MPKQKNTSAHPAKKTTGSKLRRFLFGLTATVTAIGTAPLVIEGTTDALNGKNLNIAMDKIVTAKQGLCTPPSAKTLATTQNARLQTIANSAYNNQTADWSDPLSRYKSGLKYIASSLQLDMIPSVPEQFTAKDYTTDLSVSQADMRTLGKIGIGVCFDETLDAQGLGSAYTPELGMITLSPSMSDEQTTVHFRRHLDRLKSSIITPYREYIEGAETYTTDFNRFSQIQTWLETITHGSVTSLKKDEDPNLADFVVLDGAKQKYRATVYAGPKT